MLPGCLVQGQATQYSIKLILRFRHLIPVVAFKLLHGFYLALALFLSGIRRYIIVPQGSTMPLDPFLEFLLCAIDDVDTRRRYGVIVIDSLFGSVSIGHLKMAPVSQCSIFWSPQILGAYSNYSPCVDVSMSRFQDSSWNLPQTCPL